MPASQPNPTKFNQTKPCQAQQNIIKLSNETHPGLNKNGKTKQNEILQKLTKPINPTKDNQTQPNSTELNQSELKQT